MCRRWARESRGGGGRWGWGRGGRGGARRGWGARGGGRGGGGGVGRWPEAVEEEPNDSPQLATVVGVPGAVDGLFQRAGDRDWYQFAARKGRKVTARAMTRSLGSPCDVVLRLTRADGSPLAGSKP